jgi:transcriptional regulator with XRE-family HTH domain
LIYNAIEKIRKDRNISKTDFYKAIDMTTNGYLQMVENNSIKVTTLQKIADVLRVPMTAFFEEDNWLADGTGPLGADTESSLEKDKGIDRILKQYEGLPDGEAMKMMAKHIELLELQLDMTKYLAKRRLEKIEQLRPGGGTA